MAAVFATDFFPRLPSSQFLACKCQLKSDNYSIRICFVCPSTISDAWWGLFAGKSGTGHHNGGLVTLAYKLLPAAALILQKDEQFWNSCRWSCQLRLPGGSTGSASRPLCVTIWQDSGEGWPDQRLWTDWMYSTDSLPRFKGALAVSSLQYITSFHRHDRPFKANKTWTLLLKGFPSWAVLFVHISFLGKLLVELMLASMWPTFPDWEQCGDMLDGAAAGCSYPRGFESAHNSQPLFCLASTIAAAGKEIGHAPESFMERFGFLHSLVLRLAKRLGASCLLAGRSPEHLGCKACMYGSGSWQGERPFQPSLDQL